MPSIPQSLLWISLVVLWLFVLVPMLISKRDAVRRTSDVALATRVLNGGDKSRLLKRKGRPAAGHRHDPDWQRDEDEFDEIDADDEVQPVRTRSVVVVDRGRRGDRRRTGLSRRRRGRRGLRSASGRRRRGSRGQRPADVVRRDRGPGRPEAPVERVAPVAADSDEEETIAEGDATDQFEAIGAAGPATSGSADDEQPQDGTADEYEYIEDTSGLEAEEDPPTTLTPGAGRARRLESSTAAAVTARKYRFRKRMLMGMSAVMILDRRAGLHRERRPVVGLRQQCRGDHAVPGLSAPPDPHRGAGAPSSSAADGAVATRGGEHRGPRFRPGALAAAPARCRRARHRRRGPDLRAPRRGAFRAATTTCRARPVSRPSVSAGGP